jgi:hypothetical protein
MLWEGFGWPLRAVAELRNGKLLEDDRNITVSAAATRPGILSKCIAAMAALKCGCAAC